MHLVSKAWILFSESGGRVHVSQPQKRMEVTRDVYSLNLLAKRKVLHGQILFGMAIAAITEEILMLISLKHL